MAMQTLTDVAIDMPIAFGPRKVKLSVPLLSSYLVRGMSYRQIGRLLGMSHSWISQYITKNYDSFAPLLDKTDTITAMKAKTIANMAQDKLIEHLPKAGQKDLVMLNITAGTNIDKYRLLSGQSTENISQKTIDSSASELQSRRQEIEKRLATLKRSDAVTGGDSDE